MPQTFEQFAGTFRRKELQGVLHRLCCDGAFPSADAFLAKLKSEQSTIYEPGVVPKGLVGMIHGLALQLVANRMVELQVGPEFQYLSGTPDLQYKHIITKACPSNDGILPAFFEDGSWDGMYFIDQALPMPEVTVGVSVVQGRGDGSRCNREGINEGGRGRSGGRVQWSGRGQCSGRTRSGRGRGGRGSQAQGGL